MAISLLQPLADIPVAFVDTETTGASADFGHRVVEIGIVRVVGGVKVGEYQQLIDPQRSISPGVTALTGISNSMVRGQPTFTDQLPATMEFLRGAVIVGHNIRFDLSFLGKEFRRAGHDLKTALDNAHVLDTVRLARRRFGRGGNGLQSLAPRLGLQPVVAHRALADAQTTHFVFEKMIEPLAGWRTSLADVLVAQGGPMGLMPASPREPLLPLELEEALELRKPVLMEYLDGNQHRTQRVIVPISIRRSGGELMLVAHCHLREAQRTFKIERIVQLIRIGNPDAPAVTQAASLCAEVPLPQRDIEQAPELPIAACVSIDPGVEPDLGVPLVPAPEEAGETPLTLDRTIST